MGCGCSLTLHLLSSARAGVAAWQKGRNQQYLSDTPQQRDTLTGEATADEWSNLECFSGDHKAGNMVRTCNLQALEAD